MSPEAGTCDRVLGNLVSERGGDDVQDLRRRRRGRGRRRRKKRKTNLGYYVGRLRKKIKTSE